MVPKLVKGDIRQQTKQYLNTHGIEQLTKPDTILHCHFAEQICNLNNFLTSDNLALEEPGKELFQVKY